MNINSGSANIISFLLFDFCSLFNVHTISQSHLKKLNTFIDEFVKKRTGLPPCATNAALHLKPALDKTSISTLYKTTMTQAYTMDKNTG